ncbi:glycosyltransferase, partial [Coleofasciculus sp.]|uniref:glycosyltransferase n=1 Tax=Coleofasciculus sp. TaxID=3100458 RepID=UPI0039F920F9
FGWHIFFVLRISYFNYTLFKCRTAYRELVQQILHPQCEFRPLNEALAGRSLAIHHGGLTTSLACLLAGIPQLLLPRHLEEYLNAIALTQLGVAKTVTQLTWEELFLEQAQALKLAENASHQAENLSDWNQNFMEAISSYLKSWLC